MQANSGQYGWQQSFNAADERHADGQRLHICISNLPVAASSVTM